MILHCTRGCVCDCFTVDGVDLRDVIPEVKTKLIEKVKNYLLKKQLNETDHYTIMSEVFSLEIPVAQRITEDNETCELFLDGKSEKEITSDDINSLVVEFCDYLKTDLDNSDWFLWSFMEDIIGLKYQYSCDCCGDSVYSRNFRI